MEDRYIWLEEVNGEKAIDWVKNENALTEEVLANSSYYPELFSDAKECLSDKDKTIWISIKGKQVYNFWKDENNQLGLLRRTTFDNFKSGSENWESVFDLDAYASETNVQWPFGGCEYNSDFTRGLFHLSDGGKDANFVKEFDLMEKKFIDNGFELPESKGGASYFDDDTIVCSRDFGEGTLTTSGYPRIAKIVNRGEDYLQGKIIFEAKQEDTFMFNFKVKDNNESFIINFIGHDFYHFTHEVYFNEKKYQIIGPQKISSSCGVGTDLIFSLKEDWKNFKQGSLIELDLKKVVSGQDDYWSLVYEPKANEAIEGSIPTKTSFIAHILEDIKSRAYKFTKVNGEWRKEKLNLPDMGKITYMAFDDEREEDDFVLYFEGFNKPTTTFYGTTRSNELEELRSAKSLFNHEDVVVKQEFATSNDGTKVPYFLIHHKDVEYDGTNKTILYGYGGFEIALSPYFANPIGKLWIDKKNVYVMANIRGGGEYGPAWHQAALKSNRDRAYEDFFSIAEDLFSKKITSPARLAAQGGSNGGLLMGVCYTRRPDLFKGICCQVPLLDMLRFHELLAGASWIAEYGDPDNPEERVYLEKLSPYHNLNKETDYPKIFITTSTKDDRVHPGHARKLAAKIKELGHEYYYIENFDGGHQSNVSIDKLAAEVAIRFSYFNTVLD